MTTTYLPTGEFQKQNALLDDHGYIRKKEGSRWIVLDPHGHIVSREFALETIASGKAKKVEPRFSTANRAAAIQWAHSLASRTQRDRPVVVLDTETTGVDMTDIAVQIGIMDLRGNVLMNTLVYPGDTKMSEGAFATHGLGPDKLDNAPIFTSIWVELRAIIEESDVLAYNMPFDSRILTQTAAKYGLTMPPLRTHCVMQQYSMFVGEVISPPLKPETYKVQSLAAACEHFNIVNSGAHDALADAMATRDVLLAMAALYED